MADVEKVIKGWERCKKGTCPSILSQEYKDCEYTDGLYCRKDRLIDETLELLKGTDTVKYALETLKRHGWKDATEEQREMIEFAKIFMSDEVHETAKQFRQQIVRCKDCVHWDIGHTEECDNSDSVCFHNGWCKPDWFCADAERKG